MRRLVLTVGLGFGTAMVSAQGLPPGTHSVDDHSREDAASAQIAEAESALEHGDFARG